LIVSGLSMTMEPSTLYEPWYAQADPSVTAHSDDWSLDSRSNGRATSMWTLAHRSSRHSYARGPGTKVGTPGRVCTFSRTIVSLG
jgi:hypothetical protein